MVNQHRLETHLEVVHAFSTIEGVPGVNRLAFSDQDWRVRDFLMSRLEFLGLPLKVDAFGNVIAHWQGSNADAPTVLIGSHTDSVPRGGQFDGMAGILAAIEAVQSLQEDGFTPECSIDIVLFMCEESSRFGVATLGSHAMRGLLSAERLHELTDSEGKSLYDVLKARGLDPDNVPNQKFTTPLKAFLELHIEQGAVLENAECPLGIVTGISAPSRFNLTIHGTAGHSGATPMADRHDGLCAAAEIILATEAAAKAASDTPIVATIGSVNVLPGVMNVIPGEVTLGLDVRSIYNDAKQAVSAAILAKAEKICQARDIPLTINKLSEEKPLMISQAMISAMETVANEEHFPYMTLPSGAGHDAMNWGDYTEVGMIFIPCRHGISHNPDEEINMDDLVLGTQYLEALLKKISHTDFVIEA